MPLKIVSLFILIPLLLKANMFCENNLRYEYVWDSKRMFCSARLNLKYKLSVQLTPEGLEIVNRKSSNYKPYKVSNLNLPNSNLQKKIKLYSNGGVFVYSNSQDTTDSKKIRKVNFEPSAYNQKLVDQLKKDDERANFIRNPEEFQTREQLVDIDIVNDPTNTSEGQSPYEISSQLLSCSNDKRKLGESPRKRYLISNQDQKVSYAIDPDFYFQNQIHKIATSFECEKLNTEKSISNIRSKNNSMQIDQRKEIIK